MGLGTIQACSQGMGKKRTSQDSFKSWDAHQTALPQVLLNSKLNSLATFVNSSSVLARGTSGLTLVAAPDDRERNICC